MNRARKEWPSRALFPSKSIFVNNQVLKFIEPRQSERLDLYHFHANKLVEVSMILRYKATKWAYNQRLVWSCLPLFLFSRQTCTNQGETGENRLQCNIRQDLSQFDRRRGCSSGESWREVCRQTQCKRHCFSSFYSSIYGCDRIVTFRLARLRLI